MLIKEITVYVLLEDDRLIDIFTDEETAHRIRLEKQRTYGLYDAMGNAWNFRVVPWVVYDL